MINRPIERAYRHLIIPFQLLVLGGLIFACNYVAAGQDLDVPYVPTPNDVVERMLNLVDVQPSDYVIDLGSGDGRIVIAAAKRGANGHGIDLDPKRIAEARENASKAGVDDQIMFMEQNIFDTDFSEASVITMYLLPSVNKKLRPQLLEKLQPGTEIVSHSFDMGDWKPDKKEIIDSKNSSGTHTIYYWVIPAKVSGTWKWSMNDSNYTMNLSQKYQEIAVTIKDSENNTYDIQKAKLQGNRLTIHATNGNTSYIFSGRVEGNKIYGLMQNHNGQEKTFSKWSATK